MSSITDDCKVDHLDIVSNVLSCDANGKFIIFGSYRKVYIANLDSIQENICVFNLKKKKDLFSVQWNPHISHSNLYMTAQCDLIDIWDWKVEISSIEPICSLSSHTRNICDIDWSKTQENIIGSCSHDSFTHIWDIREYKKPVLSMQSVIYASKIKWNKSKDFILATSHENDLRIWDIRKHKQPLNLMSSHEDNIKGLDWCPTNSNEILSFSENGMLKFWNTSSSKNELGNENKFNISISDSKYIPYGNGFVTLTLIADSQQNELDLNLWKNTKLLELYSHPLHVFKTTSNIIDFTFIKDNQDYQLIVWSQDKGLRRWSIDSSIQNLCDSESTNESLNYIQNIDEPFSPLPIEKSVSTPIEQFIDNQFDQDNNMSSPSQTLTNQPKTLRQEFSLLNVHITNLFIEELDYNNRSLIANGEFEEQKIRLHMLFPVEYPINVQPIFQILEGTTIDMGNHPKLIEILNHTAKHYVQSSRCCVEPCLRSLVSYLNSSDVVNKSYDPMISYSNEKLKDENVPFPRISGARFCGPGFLVCFTRFMWIEINNEEAEKSPVDDIQRKKAPSECEITPRAMSALSEMSNNKPMRSCASSLPAKSYHTVDNPSVSQYYKMKEKRPVALKSMLNKMGKIRAKNKKCCLGPVIIYDLSCLLPTLRTLGENYIFDEDVVEMCYKNAMVAHAANRKDIAQVWLLSAMQVEEALHTEIDPNNGSPWSLSPFGRNLIKIWFNHYSLVKDVQTLAMLSCVFGPHTFKNFAVESTCNNTSLLPNIVTGKPLINEINFVVQNIEINVPISPEYTSGDNLAANKRPRSSSWSKGTADIEEKPDLIENHFKNIGLLEFSFEQQCNNFIRSYSNILFQWGLLNKRAELLNYLILTKNLNKKKSNSSISTKSHLCVICHVPVIGLIVSCTDCGHGGHVNHLSEWFKCHDICPSGCNCLCVF